LNANYDKNGVGPHLDEGKPRTEVVEDLVHLPDVELDAVILQAVLELVLGEPLVAVVVYDRQRAARTDAPF
jgi:hypothetical protein